MNKGFLPHCTFCCRRLPRLALPSWGPSHVQVRGKKKSPNAKTKIPVQLLQYDRKLGSEGVVVSVNTGYMRNYLFPERIADYLTLDERRDWKQGKFVRSTPAQTEHNFTVKKDAPRPAKERVAAKPAVKPVTRIELHTLQPEAAFEELSKILPSHFDFYRTPIAIEHGAQSSAATTSKQIYGSVASEDVLNAVRALLGENALAGRVVLDPEHTRFVRKVNEEDDMHRVKKLGSYEIEIRVKGYREALRRKVRVLPEDRSAGQAIYQAADPKMADPTTPGTGNVPPVLATEEDVKRS